MDPANNTSEFAMTAISTADVSAPMVISRSFDFDPAVPPAALVYQFSEDVTPSLGRRRFHRAEPHHGQRRSIGGDCDRIQFGTSSTARLTFPGIGAAAERMETIA